MSSKKSTNSFHRSQILMPRAPYRANFALFGFSHRARIAYQLSIVADGRPLFDFEWP